MERLFELKPIKKVTSISLDKVELNIGPKDKVQLHAQVLPEDAFKKILYGQVTMKMLLL